MVILAPWPETMDNRCVYTTYYYAYGRIFPIRCSRAPATGSHRWERLAGTNSASNPSCFDCGCEGRAAAGRGTAWPAACCRQAAGARGRGRADKAGGGGDSYQASPCRACITPSPLPRRGKKRNTRVRERTNATGCRRRLFQLEPVPDHGHFAIPGASRPTRAPNHRRGTLSREWSDCAHPWSSSACVDCMLSLSTWIRRCWAAAATSSLARFDLRGMAIVDSHKQDPHGGVLHETPSLLDVPGVTTCLEDACNAS